MGIFEAKFKPLGFRTREPIDSKTERNVIESDLYIIRIDENNKKIEKLRIQCIPLELDVQPTANWAVLPSAGRNNPFYNYTGGEDTLSFTLDWYANTELKDDVLYNCRWLESLSRANGYFDEPPRIILQFGGLFKFDRWIIESAKYKLSLFDKEPNAQQISMLPRQAYQEVVLKKVTTRNTLIDDIRFSVGEENIRKNY